MRLFEIKNTRPSDLVKDLENILKAVSLDGKNATVRFLPVDRINTLIAVAPNPACSTPSRVGSSKLDVPVQVSARRQSKLTSIASAMGAPNVWQWH